MAAIAVIYSRARIKPEGVGMAAPG